MRSHVYCRLIIVAVLLCSVFVAEQADSTKNSQPDQFELLWKVVRTKFAGRQDTIREMSNPYPDTAPATASAHGSPFSGATRSESSQTMATDFMVAHADQLLMPFGLTELNALIRAREVLRNASATPVAEDVLYVFAPSHSAWHFNFLNPHFKEIMIDAVSGNMLL